MKTHQILSLHRIIFLGVATLMHSHLYTAYADTLAGEILLADSAKTEYVIVRPDAPSKVDEYSLKLLLEGLKQKTGVDFPVVSSQDVNNQKRICLGVSKTAVEDLGGNPIAELQDQEFVTKSVAKNIYLYGKGLHGNLYGVVDFLDHSLGRQWCVDEYHEKPAFKRVESLAIEPFARRCIPSFAYRMLGFPSQFNYQYGYNMCLTDEICKGWGLPEGTVSVFDNPVWVHTSFLYIPPDQGRGFDWLKDKGYFKSNPEFYGMNPLGQRVAEQLCYSNPGLRSELTKNILTHVHLIRRDKADQRPIMIALDQEDPAIGKFCHCDACSVLEQHYQSPAGAFYDYLIALCTDLKSSQADVWIKTIGYRKTQTQIPPKMPEGVKFPNNIIVVYCSVEDVINKTWQDPENAETYQNLRGWAKLTPHVWVWNYYLYSAGLLMPFSNMERMAIDMRMAKAAGAEAVQLELYPEDGFTPLLQYVYLKLSQDTDSDWKSHVRRFCECQYGPSAAIAEKYIWEVETASKTGKKNMAIIHPSVDFEGAFSYLSVDNIARWQKYFDEMNRLAEGDERTKKNVNLLRKSLDIATMGRWHGLAKAYPDYFTDYTLVKSRIGRVNLLRAATLTDWELKIQAGDVHKPLPASFDKYPKDSIYEFVPVNSANNAKAKTLLDPDAAFGYATTINNPDMPFQFGFHQNDTKTAGVGMTLRQQDIVPNQWNLYEFGEIELTPNCMIWFSSKSWETNLELGGIFTPDSANRFRAYVSLKFSGKEYGGDGESMVLCDRIILVKDELK